MLDIRSVDDELSVLAYLGGAGFVPMQEPRGQGAPDWHVSGHGRSFHVEVKSKGSATEKLDLFHEAFFGLQLLHYQLRGVRFSVCSPQNEKVCESIRDDVLDGIIKAIYSAWREITDCLVSGVGPS